ncbi:MAG: recombinase zinc beta ribbon domain-containing protein [Oscillospiraceae bacterium]
MTREEFQAVQELLKKRRRSRRGRTDTENVYLLTGKVYCGICGGKYCGNSQYSGRKKTLYYCYRCNVRSRRGGIGCSNREISRNCLKKYVLRLLADILFDKDRLPAVIEEYNRAVIQAESSVESDRKRLKKSIKSLENEVGNIISVIARTGSESLTAALDGKEKELSELRAQLSEIERRSARVDIDEEQIKRAFDYGGAAALRKDTATGGSSKLYVERVEILPDSECYANILRGLQANEAARLWTRSIGLIRSAQNNRKADREGDRFRFRRITTKPGISLRFILPEIRNNFRIF